MKLYHGTSSKYLDNILKKGIKPRVNKKSNWSAQSQKEYVYLTDMYPLFFSLHATKTKKEKMIIIEIDSFKLDENMFYPDDDFIWWNMKKEISNITLEEAGALIKYNQKYWEGSLNTLGCMAYKDTVPVDSITRYIEIDINKMSSQARMYIYGLCDVSVVPMAIAIRKPMAQDALQWLFGDNNLDEYIKDKKQLMLLAKDKSEKYFDDMQKELNEQRDKYIKIITL
jgi:hypothetical protein